MGMLPPPLALPVLPTIPTQAAEPSIVEAGAAREGGKERGPKNEEEEEEIGDGQSTAALMPGYKMSHLLAITVVAYEKCSGVTQVRTLHQQTRLRAVLEPLRTALTSTMLSYLPCNPN